jgi:signal transduction histidine kinase
MNFNKILLFLFLLFLPIVSFSQSDIILNGNQDIYKLGKKCYILRDRQARFGIEEVSQGEAATKFVPSKQDVPNLGFTNSALWLRFRLRNDTADDEEWILEVGYPLLDYIELYVPADSGNFVLKKAGDALPFEEREIEYKNALFWLKIPSGDAKTYYMRLKTESSLSAPLTLWRPQRFIEHVDDEQYAVGIYYGVMLIMILYNFFIFLSTKERIYLLYIFYIISFALLQMSLDGLAYQYLWPQSAWLNNHSTPFLIGFASFCALIFTQKFLQVENYGKKLNIIFNINILYTFFVMILSLIAGYFISIIFGTICGIIAPVVMLTAGFISRIKGFRPARFYLIAFFAFFAGCIIYALTKFAILPSNFFTENGIQIGSALQVVLLSLALGDKINILQAEKEEAQNQLIQALKEADIIKADYTKRLESMNKSLEKKVEERTAELATKNLELAEKNFQMEKAYQELKQLDRMKSDFISSVSHELRTPLTSILGFTKVIKKNYGKLIKNISDKNIENDKKCKKYIPRIDENLDIVINESEKLMKMINQVLDLSEMEAGEVQWNDQKLDVRELMGEALKLVENHFVGRDNVRFYYQIEEDLGEIYADKSRILQLINNLVSNGVNFTDEGYIKLRAFRKDNSLKIIVEDTGTGISKDDQKNIFEKFRQVGDILTDKPQGAGLGLPICKEIVEHYGGTIGVESELGKGSTFSLSLPVTRV